MRIWSTNFIRTSAWLTKKARRPSSPISTSFSRTRRTRTTRRWGATRRSSIALFRSSNRSKGFGEFSRRTRSKLSRSMRFSTTTSSSSALVGKAGTGKTLLAIAAGLAKTVDEGVYHRLLVSRPVFRSAKTSDFCPAISKKSSILGCSRSTTTSTFCSARRSSKGPSWSRQGLPGVDESGTASDRTADLYPRSLDPAAVSDRRRVAEPDSA